MQSVVGVGDEEEDISSRFQDRKAKFKTQESKYKDMLIASCLERVKKNRRDLLRQFRTSQSSPNALRNCFQQIITAEHRHIFQDMKNPSSSSSSSSSSSFSSSSSSSSSLLSTGDIAFPSFTALPHSSTLSTANNMEAEDFHLAPHSILADLEQDKDEDYFGSMTEEELLSLILRMEEEMKAEEESDNAAVASSVLTQIEKAEHDDLADLVEHYLSLSDEKSQRQVICPVCRKHTLSLSQMGRCLSCSCQQVSLQLKSPKSLQAVEDLICLASNKHAQSCSQVPTFLVIGGQSKKDTSGLHGMYLSCFLCDTLAEVIS